MSNVAGTLGGGGGGHLLCREARVSRHRRAATAAAESEIRSRARPGDTVANFQN